MIGGGAKIQKLFSSNSSVQNMITVFILSKRLEALASFFSGVDGFFSSRGLQYSFKKTSGERLLLSFDWKDENKDILVFISDFLNKFKNGFVN